MILEDGFDTVRELWAHQLEVLGVASKLRDYALFHEIGTGKSLSAVTIARHRMYRAKRAMRVLVLCPPIVLKNWKDEWLMASKFSPEEVQFTKGSGKERAKQFTDSIKVMVTNYETLLMPDVVKAIEAWGPEILIADELHKIKNSSAKRTKIAVKLGKFPTVKHRIGLTGTPVLNSPLDLFSQFHFLDKGETFGENFFMFRGQYFYDKNASMPAQKHFPDWRIRPSSLAAITEKIKLKSSHVKKSECLDLPPFVRKKILVELSSEQKKLYTSLAKDFIAYIDDKAAVAQLALTKALRLLQIVSGFVTVENLDGHTSTHTIAENPKSAALKELLGDLCQSSKVICWANFRHNYETIRRVCEELSLPYTELTGEVPQAERQKAVDAFQSDPTIRVCIANQTAAGIGVNLVASDVSIYFSRSFSLEADLQSEGRNFRGGSQIHSKVTRIDIVAEGTIDELVLERLAAKEEVSASVLKKLVLESLR